MRRVSPVLLAFTLAGCGGLGLETVDPPARPVVQSPQSQPVVQQPPAQQPVQQVQPFSGGTFTGRFVDKGTRAPIAGLEVTIGGEKKKTGADGTVTFQNLPANASFQTYHNDYVQLKQVVPGGNGPVEIQVLAMKDYV